MKNINRVDVPAEILEQIGTSRFILLSNGPFGKLVAFGDDPVVVQRGNAERLAGTNVWRMPDGKTVELPMENGTNHARIPGTTLYRVDE